MPSLSRYRCHEALTHIINNTNVGLLLHQLSPHRGRWPPHTQRWRVPNLPLSWSPSSPHSWRRDGWKSSLPPLCRERGEEKWRSTPDWMQLWKGWMDERTTLKLYRLKTVSWTCPWHQHWSEAVKRARQGRWLADEIWGAWPVRVFVLHKELGVCVCLRVSEISKPGWILL